MVADIQGKLLLTLGSVKDHASISKAMIYNHDGQGFSDMEIAVLRATGHDHGPIPDKHMHKILFLVLNPFLAERISYRLCKTRLCGSSQDCAADLPSPQWEQSQI
ncbi:hypothetical protein SLA2020_358960 [Shorea laevis]